MDSETLQCASVAFSLAAQLVYSEPQAEQLDTFQKNRVFEEAPFGQDNPSVKRGLSLINSWIINEYGISPDESLAQLQREWLALFVGYGEPAAPCWSSYYRKEGSLLLSEKTLVARKWYKKFDLENSKLGSEPDDHLGIIIGFLSHLLQLEYEAQESGDSSRAAELAGAQKEFLQDCLLSWFSEWQALVEAHAKSDYYKGVGALLAGFIEEFGRLGKL